MCFPTDVDTLLYHMNNARYLRELDFVRADFYERTELYREICSQGSGVVQGATTIRYRRYIKPFRFFKVTSKVIRETWLDCRLSCRGKFSERKFARAQFPKNIVQAFNILLFPLDSKNLLFRYYFDYMCMI